jgi:hypothetical protein
MESYNQPCERNDHYEPLQDQLAPDSRLSYYDCLVRAQACTTPKPMDVVRSKDNVDDNLIPRNPVWYPMVQTGQRPDDCGPLRIRPQAY